MSKPVNKTMIGLFVVGAIALIVVAIGVLGSGKFFQERFKYVMVFEGSVKGLNVGAPVVLRGVKIGAVSDIQMHFDYATKAITILVYVEFEKGRVVTVNVYDELVKTLGGQTQYTVMKELVGRGLRAQLEMQSIVTGQLQIALDFYPEKAAVYKGIDQTVQEIPAIPTPLQELTRKLESLPIEEIFNKVNLAMDGIAKLVQSPDLKESVTNLNIALKDVQSLVRNVDSQVKPLSAGVSETIRDTQKLIRNADSQVASVGTNLNGAIGDGRKLIKNVDGSVDSVKVSAVEMINAATAAIKEAEKVLGEVQSSAKSDSVLMYRVTESLSEVEKAARSLRILTDYLERHPEALLGGKGDGGGK
ncbi:MAG: Mammalian cell entry related domain protein [Deltaproteobacteria bacterium]|nr:Mammalian cell entry related domain protein [Deltaproteobacteria bacterium]